MTRRMSFKHTSPPLCFPLVHAGAAGRLLQTKNLGNLGAGTPIWSPHLIKYLILYTGKKMRLFPLSLHRRWSEKESTSKNLFFISVSTLWQTMELLVLQVRPCNVWFYFFNGSNWYTLLDHILIHSWLLRCSTARGYRTRCSLVDPTKVKAHKHWQMHFLVSF